MNAKHIAVLLTVPLLLLAGCSRDVRPPVLSTPTAGVSTTVNMPSETPFRTMSPGVTSVPGEEASDPTQQAPVPVPAPSPAPVDEDCSSTLQGWNNAGPKGTGENYGREDAGVMGVDVGQHACFDQVTISINTTDAIGSHFEYTNDPAGDATGFAPNPPIAGGIVLQGSVFVWSKDLTSSGAIYEHGPEKFAGWQALREVRYDTTFEGQTSFFIGVVSDNAFRMRSWLDGDVRKIIIQVAH